LKNKIFVIISTIFLSAAILSYVLYTVNAQNNTSVKAYSTFIKQVEMHNEVAVRCGEQEINLEYFTNSAEHIKFGYSHLINVSESNRLSKLYSQREEMHTLFNQYWEAQAQLASSDLSNVQINKRYLEETYHQLAQFEETLREGN
jgi:hypothetical protein